MVKSTKTTSRAELQRRHQQSLHDSELRRRREQSARDRARNERELSARLTRALTQYVYSSIPTNPPARIPNPPVSLESITMPLPRRPFPWNTESDSARAFDSLFNNPKYSDATVYLGQSKIPFPAHRLVLGIRSPYFDDALQSGFKEGITHEISFEKDSPHALWRVLRYIYTRDYADEPSETLDSEGDDLELLKHPRVCALADMFRMEDLMEVSCKKFELQLQQHWISDTFPDCIREIYSMSSNSTAIRKIIVDVVSSHKEELVQKRPFQELIREVGDFAVDLVLRIASQEHNFML